MIMAGAGISAREAANGYIPPLVSIPVPALRQQAALRLRDRIQIVVYAYETGLVTPQGRTRNASS